MLNFVAISITVLRSYQLLHRTIRIVYFNSLMTRLNSVSTCMIIFEY
jgi:hypothetical protein